MALSALAERYSPKKLAPLTTKKPGRKKNSKPLFALDADDPEVVAQLDEEDLELLAAMHRSIEDAEDEDMQRAIEESTLAVSASTSSAGVSHMEASSSRSGDASTTPLTTPRNAPQPLPPIALESDSDDDMYASPTRLETALSIANAGPRAPLSTQRSFSAPKNLHFGVPSLLVSPTQSPKASLTTLPQLHDTPPRQPAARPRRPHSSLGYRIRWESFLRHRRRRPGSR